MPEKINAGLVVVVDGFRQRCQQRSLAFGSNLKNGRTWVSASGRLRQNRTPSLLLGQRQPAILRRARTCGTKPLVPRCGAQLFLAHY